MNNQKLFIVTVGLLVVHFAAAYFRPDMVINHPLVDGDDGFDDGEGDQVDLNEEEKQHVFQTNKRYPPHLDPTIFKFWTHIGECPESLDGVKQYFCPSLNSDGRHVCIDDYQLCNGMKECPMAEDEDQHYCLFYKALRAQVQLLERSVTTLSNDPELKSPVRRYVNTFGRNMDE